MTRLCSVVVLALTLAAGSAFAQQPIEIGTRFTIPSQVLHEDRTVFVRVPAGHRAGNVRYPVLYLTDGEANFAHTAAMVEFLARVGRIPEMIVVGIGNTNRTRDLTPTHVENNPFGNAQVPLQASGGGDRFLEFIEQELIPWVEKQYRTEPFRVFAGHSFGGLFATHAFFTKPALFNGVIAVSPTLFWDGDLPTREAQQFLERPFTGPRTLVVTVGNEGPQLQRSFERFREVLRKARSGGLHYQDQQFEDDDHGSLVMRTHELGLRTIFDGWQLPRDPSTGQYTGTLTQVQAHYAALSGKLGWRVRPPEAVVNNLGYAALANRKVADALASFQMNLELYPESPNVHDSLGEGLEAANRLEEAVRSYERAVELGKKVEDPNLAVFKQHLEGLRKRMGTN